MAESSAPIVAHGGREMVAFLGVRADERLLDADLVNLPDAGQHREPVISNQRHDRLVAAGPLLTAERAWISNPRHRSSHGRTSAITLGSAGAFSPARQPPARSVRPLSPGRQPVHREIRARGSKNPSAYRPNVTVGNYAIP